jgi:predicted glycoside hydrolase/deacetylase ChbG (UPF0249 family)
MISAPGHPRTGARELVVNADDFGLSLAINRGIIEAYEAGAVTSVSLMPTMPAFDDAVRYLTDTPVIPGVGVHLTLTVGAPLTSAPSLTDPRTGDFHPLPRLVALAITNRVRAADVAAECRAQVRRVRDRGIAITHLDSHHHAHLLPGVWRVVYAVAREEGIAVVRRPAEPLRGTPEARHRIVERLVVRALCANADRAATVRDGVTHFRGEALSGSPSFARSLARTIETLPPGRTELMVHPGYADRALPGNDPYTWQREIELAALLSPSILALLHDGRVTLRHH